jgi:ABC-type Fe3+/spermidine/putrescine transport system ATPase subunit
VLAETFVAAPFLIIAARSAFAAIDPVLEGVGATLGRQPLDVFLRVSLPIAWPTLRSGLLLAWLRAFGEFGATVMVAYHPYSLPVYTYVAFGAEGLPAMLPVLLPTLVLALAVMALSGLAAGDRAEGRYSTRAGGELAPAAAPAPSAARSPARPHPVDLAMRLEKQLGGFRLGIAWSPRAGRLAILGPSGSGKSLTLKLLTGIERCDRGSVVLGCRELSQLDPAARSIAYVPQNYGLFPHLTVLEQLRFPVGAEAGAAEHWVDRLGLGGLERRFPAALSLGQQQRVALARALVRPAELLLLDEPFSALDAPLRTSLRQELRELQAEFGATTILVTHDPEEAALLADELLVLEAGRVLQSGPTEQVFRRPASETVARLLGAKTLATGVAIDRDRIAIGGGVLLRVGGPALGSGERVGWSLPQGCVELSASGVYQGIVESQSVIGAERRITIRLGNARIDLPVARTDLASGALCRFDIDPESVQVWPSDQPRGTQAFIEPLPTISTSAP